MLVIPSTGLRNLLAVKECEVAYDFGYIETPKV
jgi:hypothetical protein